MDIHHHAHQRAEHVHVLYVTQDPEAIAHLKVSPEVRFMHGRIAIVQDPDPDPPLAAEPDLILAAAVEVTVVSTVGVKAAHLPRALVLPKVQRYVLFSFL